MLFWHGVANHEIGYVAVERFFQIAAPQNVEIGIKFLQHLPHLGVAVAGGQGVGESAGVPVQGPFVFFTFFQFDVVIDPVGDGQGLHGLASGAIHFLE